MPWLLSQYLELNCQEASARLTRVMKHSNSASVMKILPLVKALQSSLLLVRKRELLAVLAISSG